MLEKTGIATPEDIESVFPTEERLEKGPVVIVECFREIPCNPCYTACNQNAIREFLDINDLPDVDHDACNGCGLCISKCPGLAIRVLDMTWSEDHAMLRIPYEFLPLPEKGDRVKGLDREGRVITEVEVHKVQNSKAQDKTPVIWLKVDKQYAKELIHIRTEEEASIRGSQEMEKSEGKEPEDSTIVCRCSDITLGEVRAIIAKGFTTFDEIKRLTRVGMGPCQGTTCGQLVLREISMATGIPVSQLSLGTYRPPIKSVNLGEIADKAQGGDKE